MRISSIKKTAKKNKWLLAISIAALACLSATFGLSPAADTGDNGIGKNETVYEVLSHDGTVKDVRVINWAYGAESGKYWVDYGNYTDIANMTTEDKPVLEGEKILWPMSALEAGNFYYQGITEKELPVTINIDYYLDGEKSDGTELAGKSGKLRIVIKVKNRLINSQPVYYRDYEGFKKDYYEEYYTPLYVQVLVKADLGIFSNIEANDAVKVVSGEEMSISFGTFPFPDAEFEVKMDGNGLEGIELEPINITVIPMEVPSIVPAETEEKLSELAAGIDEMEDGAAEITGGLDEILDMSGDLENGSVDLVNAIADINHGAYSLESNSGEIGRGIEEMLSGTGTLKAESARLVEGLAEINQSSSDIEKAITETASGLSYISSTPGTLAAGLDSIIENQHSNLVSIIKGLVASDPANETYQTLLAIAEGEQAGLSSISSGIKDFGSAITGLSDGMSLLSGSYSQFAGGLNQLAIGAAGLPDGIGQLYDGQKQLYEGWGDYSKGAAELYSGTQQLYDGTRSFPEDMSKLVKGLKEIRDGTYELENDGIGQIKDGITGNLNELRQGEALQEEINKLAKEYTSFMDNNRNKNSSVQFIMQTQEIKKQEIGSGTQESRERNLTLWEKIRKFFGK